MDVITRSKITTTNQSSAFLFIQAIPQYFTKLTTPFLFKLSLLLLSVYFIANQYEQENHTLQASEAFIQTPKINDLYFIDFRKLSNNLRPNEKYRLAKVVDITGDVITLRYGSFFYSRQNAMVKSIHYGQLRYADYFEGRRVDFSHQQVVSLWQNETIYMVQRPVYGRVFRSLIEPFKFEIPKHEFVSGKRENNAGIAFLNSPTREDNFSEAFQQLSQSAAYEYAPGQTNLAELYLDQTFENYSQEKALHWFLQAALQSHKPAVLKYVIVCERIPQCNVNDFFQLLVDAGVNIKVRKSAFKLQPSQIK